MLMSPCGWMGVNAGAPIVIGLFIQNILMLFGEFSIIYSNPITSKKGELAEGGSGCQGRAGEERRGGGHRRGTTIREGK